MTVSGFTIATVSAHRDQIRESTIQNARSTGARCGRFCLRRSTARCGRSARFSATRLALGRSADRRAPTIATIRSTTDPRSNDSPRLSPANRHCRCARVAPRAPTLHGSRRNGFFPTTTGVHPRNEDPIHPSRGELRIVVRDELGFDVDEPFARGTLLSDHVGLRQATIATTKSQPRVHRQPDPSGIACRSMSPRAARVRNASVSAVVAVPQGPR
jgi:hypothetical protein